MTANSSDALTSLLNSMMSSAAPAGSVSVTNPSIELEVESVGNIQVQQIEVILQGRRQVMSHETLRTMVAGQGTFRTLLEAKYQNSSTNRISGVSVTIGGSTPSNYTIDARIPASILEAQDSVRISFSSESGTNG